METVSLKASTRIEHGKGAARRLRAQGRIPAVAYGTTKKDPENINIPLAVESDALRDILIGGRGRNSLIDLEVEGGQSHLVMIKDFTIHPVSRRLLHADFQRIDEGRPIIVEVPFRTEGKSEGEAQGGTLLSNVRTLKLRCLPTNIPDQIVHDVTEVQIDEEVTVADLALPENVEVLMRADRKLAVVIPPRVVAEVVADAEVPEGTEPAGEGEASEGAAAGEGGGGES